jgi:small-conductance mechanosensitive channel
LTRLPLFVLALVVFLVSLVLVKVVISLVSRGMHRGNVDFTVQRLVTNLLRIVLLLLVMLFALALAGVEVGAVLAALGLIGLGVALALQNILENLISGVLILMRKPYDRGEYIATNDIEGYVEDIELRVTTIRSLEGVLTLVPNADIYRSPLTNLTRRGTRRSLVNVGIDYRDDHVLAKDVLLQATKSVPEVMEEPPPRVFLVGLGDSSVDYSIPFWTSSDLLEGISARDLVLTACKSAIEDAGMTIPWPIRTLAADKSPLQIDQRARDGHAPLPDRAAPPGQPSARDLP